MSESEKKPPCCNTGVKGSTDAVSTWRVDWIAGTYRTGEVPDFIKADISKNVNGLSGYTQGVRYSNGVTVYENPTRPDMGKHVVMSGGSLALIELKGIELLAALQNTGMKFSRVDVAIDAVGFGFNLQKFEDEIKRFTDAKRDTAILKTRAKSISIWANKTTPGSTVYFGRKSSSRMLRIYDKGAQLGTENTDHWRFEIVLKKPVVEQYIKQMVGYGTKPQELIKGFVDFPQMSEYQKLMGATSVSVKGEKVENRTKAWLISQVAPALAKVLIEDGDQAFLFDFINTVRELHAELDEDG